MDESSGERHSMTNMRERSIGDTSISFESMSRHRFNFGRSIQDLQYLDYSQIV